MHRRQPGGGNADQSDAAADPEAQPQGIQDVVGQYGVDQMRPGVAGTANKEIEADAGNWQSGQQGDDESDKQQGRILGGTHTCECEL